MKTQFKTASILLVTFIAGGVLGFVLHATFIRDDFKKHAMRMRTPEGFIHHFERVIEPTDEQKKEIRGILRKHFAEMIQHQEEFRTKMDSVRKDIEAVLTEEQIEKLRKAFPFSPENDPRFRRHEKRHRKLNSYDPPPPLPPDSLMR